MDIEVDARGLNCPLPVIQTKKALEDMVEGDITVVIERPEGCQNVVRFAESQGCQVTIEEKEGLFHIHIHKEKATEPVVTENSQSVVFITTDCLGTGDPALGQILMKAFLNTLWNAEPRPTRLLFLNDAVKLTTEGSESLDSLQLLEKAGVEIFSCGTCLDYYHLTEKLRVGQITNMYHTVDSLLSAGKIVKI